MNNQLPALREKKVRRRSSRKLLFLLFFLFMLLLAILFFRSSISKIAEIQIVGNQLTDIDQLKQAIMIDAGDSYFSASRETIRKRVLSLEPVQDAIVEKSFPGHISIQVVEHPTVAYELSRNHSIIAILANGASVEASDVIVLDKPFLTHWESRGELKAKLCQQLAGIPDSALADISEIRPYPSKAYPDKIKMYTRSQFEVDTTISYLAKKITYLNAILETQEPGYVTMLEADTYQPYAASIEEEPPEE